MPAYTTTEENSDQVGIRTYDLRILITVALWTVLHSQNGSRLWVLEIEAGN